MRMELPVKHLRGARRDFPCWKPLLRLSQVENALPSLHSPPELSPRTCLIKFPSSNLQGSQSLPEQGINFSAPTADEPQKHEVVLALHFSVEELRRRQEGHLVKKTHPRQYFFSGPDL